MTDGGVEPPSQFFLRFAVSFPLMRAKTYSAICAVALAPMLVATAQGDESRRLFDFAPVSATNPVVATIDDAIEIPLSELRAYREAEHIGVSLDNANIAGKRALLEELIDEYLSVDDAYRNGVTQAPGFLKRMNATRTMILTDFLANQVLREKGEPSAAADDPVAKLGERLFDAAVIEISNESYAVVQQAAKEIDAVSATGAQLGPVSLSPPPAEKLRMIVRQTPESVLVRYDGKSISVHQLLAIYAGLPPPRPELGTHDGLLGMIKPFVIPELMALEAVKRGIDREPAFREKLIQTRNALLRFQMQGDVDRQANELMNRPDVESQIHSWYDSHRTNYRGAAPESGNHISTYAEVRSQVEADYSVVLRDRLLAERSKALRKTRLVKIDEKALGLFVAPDRANSAFAQSDAESRAAVP
jgi:hypothetical protein